MHKNVNVLKLRVLRFVVDVTGLCGGRLENKFTVFFGGVWGGGGVVFSCVKRTVHVLQSLIVPRRLRRGISRNMGQAFLFHVD